MVSIIFITRNREKELLRAIESCKSQSYRDVEYIIIDNASERNAEKIYARALGEIGKDRFQYIFSEENLGVAEGRNYGFSLAKGEYCFFLDDDAVITAPHFFEKAIKDFQNDPAVAAIACWIEQPLDQTRLVNAFVRGKNNAVIGYVGAAHFLRTEYWRNAHLYPSELMFGSEELYASLYIYKKGHYILLDKELCVDHLPSVINRVEGKSRALNIIVNSYTVRKYFYPFLPSQMLKLCFILHLLKNGILNLADVWSLCRQRYNVKFQQTMSPTEYRRYKASFSFLQRY